MCGLRRWCGWGNGGEESGLGETDPGWVGVLRGGSLGGGIESKRELKWMKQCN